MDVALKCEVVGVAACGAQLQNVVAVPQPHRVQSQGGCTLSPVFDCTLRPTTLILVSMLVSRETLDRPQVFEAPHHRPSKFHVKHPAQQYPTPLPRPLC